MKGLERIGIVEHGKITLFTKNEVAEACDQTKAETIENVLKAVQSTIDRTHVLVLASDLTDLLTQIKQL